MPKLHPKLRDTQSMRLLVWLVDERQGRAPAREIAETFYTSKMAIGQAFRLIYAMQRAGWVQTVFPSHAVNTSSLRDQIVLVTESGFLWRDYLRWVPFLTDLGPDNVQRFIRCLKHVAEPLAKLGQFLRDNPEHREIADHDLAKYGINSWQAIVAAEVVFDSDDRNIIYPWTPLLTNTVHTGYKTDDKSRATMRNLTHPKGDGGGGGKVLLRGEPEVSQPGDGGRDMGSGVSSGHLRGSDSVDGPSERPSVGNMESGQ